MTEGHHSSRLHPFSDCISSIIVFTLMSPQTTAHRLRSIRRRNRLIAFLPWLSRVGELRQIFTSAKRWRSEGWFVPVPHFVRRAMLLSQARALQAEVFVETGTYKGGTTWSLLNEFREIITIEVDHELARIAEERFRKFSHVTLIEGDSATLLAGICANLGQRPLFYLDGHYSGGVTGMGSEECPVLKELEAIFSHTHEPFRIVIDDARLFGSDPAYPDFSVVAELVSKHDPNMTVRIENDAILIY